MSKMAEDLKFIEKIVCFFKSIIERNWLRTKYFSTNVWVSSCLYVSLGVYVCSECGQKLFSSTSKFEHSSPETIHEDSVSRHPEAWWPIKR